MKTQEEMQKEIEALKAIRPKVRPCSMFGDDNLAQLDVQIEVLEQDLDSDEISDRYDRAGVSEEIVSAAFHAWDWINDEFDPESDGSLAEGWPLKEEYRNKEGESNDN